MLACTFGDCREGQQPRSEVVDFRLRNKCGNEQETIWKEEKTQEEKDEAAYDCVSVEDNRHIDTSYNDNTYGLRMCNDTAPVTSMENNAPGVCVVVDAGHGGSDGYCEISLIESVSERRNYFEQGADGYYNGKANTSSADTIGNDKGGMVK